MKLLESREGEAPEETKLAGSWLLDLSLQNDKTKNVWRLRGQFPASRETNQRQLLALTFVCLRESSGLDTQKTCPF